VIVPDIREYNKEQFLLESILALEDHNYASEDE